MSIDARVFSAYVTKGGVVLGVSILAMTKRSAINRERICDIIQRLQV